MLDLLQDTSFWVLISFTLFAVFMFVKARGALIGLFDKRIAEIKLEINTAEALRVEAQELLAEYERKHRDAGEEAAQILKTSEGHVEKIREDAKNDIKDMTKRREKQLKQRLAMMEEETLAEIKTYTSNLAIEITEEIIAKHLASKKSSDQYDDDISKIGDYLKKVG